MTYRDPTVAIRQRVELRREDVEARGQRITADLIRQLPEPLRQELLQSKEAAYGTAQDIPGWRELEQQIERYATTVEQIYLLAPMLDERFSEIKRGYCSSLVPRHYSYPDIYAQGVDRLRQQLHDKLRSFDSKVRFADERPEYFNTTEHPLLVDAQLRVRGVPVTLAAHNVQFNANQSYVSIDYIGFLIRCYVPRGLPSMEILPQGAADAALQWVGLQKDTRTGDALFDRAYRIVQPADLAVPRILNAPIRRALRLLRTNTSSSQQLDLPRLLIHQAVAHISWLEKGTIGVGLEPALTLLRQLRKAAPPVLLREAKG